MGPIQRSPERAFALQKYLLLHSQHDALQKHLDHITSVLPLSPSANHPSISLSPTENRHSSLSSLSTSSDSDSDYVVPTPPHPIKQNRRSISTARPQRPILRQRRSSLPIVVDESILDEIEEDECKLKDVNLQIKGTLTELLNCESVRSDRRYRMWVQTRLMDAERELTKARKGSCERRMSLDVGGLRL